LINPFLGPAWRRRQALPAQSRRRRPGAVLLACCALFHNATFAALQQSRSARLRRGTVFAPAKEDCAAASQVQEMGSLRFRGQRMSGRLAVAKGDSDKAKAEKIVIKKYANRRLYNTAMSSYVTLDDLSKMVRAGQDFAVYDAKTGEDITRSVLTQIIFEEEAKGQSMLPTNFLRQIISLYGDALQGVVPSYLEASMETFAQNQERMRQAFGGDRAMANFEAMARSNMEWFQQAMRMFSPFGAAAAGAAGKPSEREAAEPPARPEKPAADLSQDLDQLQRQLSEMQAQLERLTRNRQ
jgi:polyhydroxyalkanoate synthesis repressor PhaR